MATIASHPPPAPLEVRCAGCGETLEVEQGLTDFICPDCATPQSLPPELMPRKKKALPLPRGVDSSKVQLPCASCNTPLNVPHGLSRFECPKCEVELAVDHDMLKKFLVGSSEAAAAIEVIPSGVRFRSPAVDIRQSTPDNAVTPSSRTRIASSVGTGQTHKSAPQRTLVPARVVAENNAPTPLKAQLPLSASVEQHNEVASSSGAPVFTSVNAWKKNAQARSKTLVSSSTCLEEREEVVALPLPQTTEQLIPDQRKRGRKCLAKRTAVLTSSPDNAVPSLRRSGRLAKNNPVESTKSGQTQKQASSLSNQSQLGETDCAEGQLQPQDIARHYNELFSMDLGQLLTESPQPHSETRTSGSQHSPHMEPSSDLHFDSSLNPHLDLSSDPHHNPSPDSHPVHSSNPLLKPSLNHHEEPSSELHPHHSPDERFLAEPVSDSEGDEAYVPEADSSECESDQESIVSRALRRLRKRSINADGAYTMAKGTKRCRGPNRCLEVWNRPDNDPIEVEFNHLGQPIGKESFLLASFMGIIARDGKLMPLNILMWRDVPIELKETIWKIVKSKFKLQEVRRAYVMKAMNRLWSNWKSVLKKRHYDVHDNDEARLADINKRVRPEQWPVLVRYWGSEEFKRMSAVNKECRKKLKNVHTTGTKSFARIREEERMKRPDKEELSRAEMFILTRTRKDGTALDEQSAEIIARLQEELKKGDGPSDIKSRNDLLASVLGGDDSKYVRTFGPLPLKIASLDSGETKGKAMKRTAAYATPPKDEAVEPRKDKMKELEKRHKEMEEEMNRMRSTMMAMQQFISTQQQFSDQRGSVTPGFFGGHTD